MAEPQGPWKLYRESDAKKIKFTLEEIELPMFWVEVRNQSIYTSIELRETLLVIQKEHQEYIEDLTKRYDAKVIEVEAAKEAGTMTDTEADEILFSVEFMDPAILSFVDRYMILAWNITDPFTGEILPTPKEDAKSLFQLPTEVQYFIKNKVDEALQASISVPKVSGNN